MEDEIDFLGRNLQAALKSRGINLNYVPGSAVTCLLTLLSHAREAIVPIMARER